MAIDLFGGGAGIPNQLLFFNSGTWSAPVGGKFLITAIGGGGGGGSGIAARGGGAGGLSQSFVSLEAGTQITFSIGAGGGQSSPGGTTTVSGSGFTTLIANGGGGGSTSGETIGGTASGGNIMNVQGGGSENINWTGGGAVGVYGVGYSAVYRNGAGTGSSGDVNGPGGSIAVGASSSAFSSGISTDIVNTLIYGGFTQEFSNGRILCPIGGVSNYLIHGAAGCGGKATNPAGNGGAFAGGGVNTSSTGGRGGILGGGGGGGSSIGGAGGQGGVIIEWLYV